MKRNAVLHGVMLGLVGLCAGMPVTKLRKLVKDYVDAVVR